MIIAYIINVASLYLLVFNNEERSSMYTANNDGDNIPPCGTPLEIVKYGEISAPHLITYSSCLVYQNISILTIRICIDRLSNFLNSVHTVIKSNTIIGFRRVKKTCILRTFMQVIIFGNRFNSKYT